MQIYYTVNDLVAFLSSYSLKKIGFVPTMGALHDGHVSLIDMAKKNNDLVVCSIFVNPTQFNNKNDLIKYPRVLDKDIKILKKAKCDILFAPPVSEIYPKNLRTLVNIPLDGIDLPMEGAFRPGHFKGMMQVVNRLLKIVNPHHLYMGQKDFQQFTIVQKMINHFKYNIKLIVCPILRESNGLAMSSRNERLSPDARKKAGAIYKTLLFARKNFNLLSISDIEKLSKSMLIKKGLSPDYFSFVNGHSLQKIRSKNKHSYIVICVAAWIENVRLIDNLILKQTSKD